MDTKNLIWIVAVLLLAGLGTASADIPVDNWDFQDYYNLSRVKQLNASEVCLGSDSCRTNWPTGKNASGYLYNNTYTILLNDTLLNLTVDQREVDTNTNCSVSGSCAPVFYQDNVTNPILEETHNHSCRNLTGTDYDACTNPDTTIGNCSVAGSCSPIIYLVNTTSWDKNEADDFILNGTRNMSGNTSFDANGTYRIGSPLYWLMQVWVQTVYATAVRAGTFYEGGVALASKYCALAGCTMAGTLDMDNNDIDNVGTIDAATITEGSQPILTDATVFVGDVTGTSGAMTVDNTQGLSETNITDDPWVREVNLTDGTIDGINSTDWRNFTGTEDQITDLSHTVDSNASNCANGNYLDGTNNCIPFNTTVNQLTASVIYNVTSNATLSGTEDAGNISSFLVPNDGNSWNVSEASGSAPVLRISLNFTSVIDFNTVLLYEKYIGGGGHEIYVELWNYNTNAFDKMAEITDMVDFDFLNIPVYASTSYISGGLVQLRFDHQQNGNTGHDFFIDYAVLIDGFTSVTTSEHDALSGRDSTTNHPWALDKAGTRALTDNWNAGSWNITVEACLADDWTNVTLTDDNQIPDDITLNTTKPINTTKNIYLLPDQKMCFDHPDCTRYSVYNSTSGCLEDHNTVTNTVIAAC
jgi:hypothetical protein